MLVNMSLFAFISTFNMSQKEYLVRIKPTGGKPRIPTFSPEYMSNTELHENVRLHDAARIEAQRIHDEHVRLHDAARIEAQRIHEENVRLHETAFVWSSMIRALLGGTSIKRESNLDSMAASLSCRSFILPGKLRVMCVM